MSSAIQAKINQLEEIQNNMDAFILGVIKANESKILQLNTESQLFEKGIDSDGRKLQPPYQPATKQRKRKKGQPTNRITLRDEKDFHLSFLVRYGIDDFEISSTDPKSIYLLRRYGKGIFGLTDDSIKEVRKMVLPLLVAKVKSKL